MMRTVTAAQPKRIGKWAQGCVVRQLPKRLREVRVPSHTAFFFSNPGSVHRATHTGTWGDARDSNAEFGERYLKVLEDSTIRLLDDIERTFEAMPPR